MEQTSTTERVTPTPTPAPAPASPAAEPASAATESATTGRSPGNTFEALAVVGFVFGLFAVIAAVFAVGLAARAVSEAQGSAGAGGGGGGGGPATLEVTATEFSFDPSEAEISSTGTITLNNAGDVQHDLVVDSLTTDVVEPGGTGELALDGIEPGDYDYYCSIPGHRDAGMEGTFSVG